MDPAPFLRGNPYPSTRSVAYPRAKPGDTRIPGDTWWNAVIPVGVRLEFTGDAGEVLIDYTTTTEKPAWQRPEFELWCDGALAATAPAVVGEGRAVLAHPGGRGVIYLPERMYPRVVSFEGSVEPPPAEPRWLCYGDSIAEGWTASMPSLGWPSIVARDRGLDLVNMGYAGSARGELCSAEQLAELPADLISITYGTNCWSRVAFTPALMAETLTAFVRTVRTGHPATPILVQSMLVRPDADDTPNAVGATHGRLREAFEDAARALDVTLVEGLKLIDSSMLADDVHPNDDGHAAIAAALGPVLEGMVR